MPLEIFLRQRHLPTTNLPPGSYNHPTLRGSHSRISARLHISSPGRRIFFVSVLSSPVIHTPLLELRECLQKSEFLFLLHSFRLLHLFLLTNLSPYLRISYNAIMILFNSIIIIFYNLFGFCVDNYGQQLWQSVLHEATLHPHHSSCEAGHCYRHLRYYRNSWSQEPTLPQRM